MSKMKMGLQALSYLFVHPYKSLSGIYQAKQMYGRQEYRPFRRIDLADIVNENDYPTVSITYSFGGSQVTDYILLKALSKRFEGGNFLEVGTWRGESLKNVYDANTFQSLTFITLKPEDDTSKGIGVQSYGAFVPKDEGVQGIFANSFTYDFERLEKKFDLIFIDADHSYEGILNDTRKAFPLLKDDNSIIVWHDYAHGNEFPISATLNAICDGIPAQYHRHLYHVVNTKCAILYRGKIKSNLYDANLPNQEYFYDVTIERRKL